MADQFKVIRSSDVARCSKHSMLGAHYRTDGSCRCADRERLEAELAGARTAVRAAQGVATQLRRDLQVC
jgi:hypothetical protein